MGFFDTIFVKKPKRNTYKLGHNHIFTMNIGDLVPANWEYVLPGDRINLRTDCLVKFAPLVAPAFARMKLKTEHFFVPFSQLYNYYQEVFMNYKGENTTYIADGVRSTENYQNFPYVTNNDISQWFNGIDNWAGTLSQLRSQKRYDLFGGRYAYNQFRCSRLLDYFGFPLPLTIPRWREFVNGNKKVNPVATSFWGTVNLNEESNFPYGFGASVRSGSSGEELDTENVLKFNLFPFRAYQKVYNDWYRNQMLTDPVDLYLNTEHIEYSTGFAYSRWFNSHFFMQKRNYKKDYFNTSSVDPTLGPDSVNVPDTVTELRKANAIQRILEKKALAGPNFYDWLKYTWNVFADNYEVDRSVYLGGSTQNVKISEVQSNFGDVDNDVPLGSRAGEANVYGVGTGSYFVAPDYGIVLTIVSLVPEIDYFCGIDKMLTKVSWEDFPMPELAQIGMQEIKEYELKFIPAYTDGFSLNETSYSRNMQTFGYVPRYSEWKSRLNKISGSFRRSLDFWHQSPNYYSTYISGNTRNSVVGNNQWFSEIGQGSDIVLSNADDPFEYYNQIFAVSSDYLDDHIQASMYIDFDVNRALPVEDMPHL